MLKILENMGCHTELEKDCVVVDTWDAGCGQISEEDAAAMRSSVMLMGAMLGRMKEIRLPLARRLFHWKASGKPAFRCTGKDECHRGY